MPAAGDGDEIIGAASSARMSSMTKSRLQPGPPRARTSSFDLPEAPKAQKHYVEALGVGLACRLAISQSRTSIRSCIR